MICIPESIVICLTNNMGKMLKIVLRKVMHNFVECDKAVFVSPSLKRFPNKFHK